MCTLFSQIFLYFLSSEKYVVNVYMFHNRVVARYEVETATIREDAYSSQAIDATKIYLDKVGGVKKKLVYDLESMRSLCLQLVSQFRTLKHRHKGDDQIEALEKEMSVMREQMM